MKKKGLTYENPKFIKPSKERLKHRINLRAKIQLSPQETKHKKTLKKSVMNQK